MYKNFDNAFYHLTTILKKEYGIVNIDKRYVNNKRYATIRISDKTYLILYKKDFYQTFGKTYLGINELGESVNVEHLKLCLVKYRTDFRGCIYLYPNGSIYYISINDIIGKGFKDTRSFEQVETYSFSIKLLENITNNIKVLGAMPTVSSTM